MNMKKLLSIMFVLVILVSTASGISAYFTSSFDFGVEDAEKKVFDLQVKLRNLTTGNLTEKLLNNPDLTKDFEKLSPPSVSYAFGTDYLVTLLSSSSSSDSSSGPDSLFSRYRLSGNVGEKGDGFSDPVFGGQRSDMGLSLRKRQVDHEGHPLRICRRRRKADERLRIFRAVSCGRKEAVRICRCGRSRSICISIGWWKR